MFLHKQDRYAFTHSLVEDDQVPPGLFPPGSHFSGGNVLEGAFSGSAAPAIQMNEDGELVFLSEVDVPGDPPKVPTVWSNRTGELELVLRGRQRGVAFSEFGDVAPGVPNGHFFFPNNIDIRENGDIVLRAFVETNNNLFDSTMGIWVRRGDEFEPVAFEEGPVPDLPGVTFIPETQNVRGVGNFFLEPDGTIVYTGFFFVEGDLSLGIFRHEVDGTAAMIFRTDAEADINGTGDDIRTISNFRPGIGSSDTGAKVAEVFFTDGSAGLYTYDVIPDETSTPLDFNAFRGFLVSGGLDDLLESDDSDLCFNPGIVLNPAEAPVTLDFLGTLPNDSPSSLNVTIESSANTVGLELTISFWNFNTNSWDIVGTDGQSLNADTVRTFAGVPADHLEPGTGEVRTRYEVRVVSFIFIFPWLDCVDHVYWSTTG